MLHRLIGRALLALGAASLVLTPPAAYAQDAIARGLAARALEATTDRFDRMTLPSNQVERIAFGACDSRGAGAGSDNPKTFVEPYAAAQRARFGDAGSGYIPFTDGPMASIGHTAGWAQLSAVGPGTNLYRWDDPRRGLAFGGLGYYRDGGVGDQDSSYSLSYTPSPLDNNNRGTVDTIAVARIYFVLRSANAGFQIRQSDRNPLFDGLNISSGATFTATGSGTSFTASNVVGVIARGGVRIAGGGIAASTTTSKGGSNRGGAGQYNTNTPNTITAGTALSSDPNVMPAVGVPQYVDFYYNPSNSQTLQIVGVYGDVLFSGIETFNGKRGVTISNICQGGTTAYQWASLDDAAQRRYWQLANFSTVYVALGVNDRGVVDPGLYGAYISTIVSRIQANPRTRVVLVYQGDTGDVASTFFPLYGAVLRSIALAMGTGFYDEHTCPGFTNFATANAAGYMNADQVHYSAAGNIAMGRCYADRYKTSSVRVSVRLPAPANDNDALTAAA